jgi:predicted alpha/beta-hydrolase family hydrolase
MPRKRVSIPVRAAETVSGVLSVPEEGLERTGTSVILAHGAGNDMEHPLIVTLSDGLSEAGFVTLRFNFPYSEKGHRKPDPQNTLVLTWLAGVRFLQENTDYAAERIIAAGKSMGGRVASQMVAEGLLPASGLIFLGYPLHRPGKREKRRDAHLYHIKIPMLFFTGTRDPLCDLTLLRDVLDRLKAPSDLETIEGGDHSFRLPKGTTTDQQGVYDRILQNTLTWLG